ncbi:hypothetical protein [Streptomyces sp. NBC_00140]|uniref:hypothetical protein n=1 Tax=Streptomyces sp. NBC_00140 TaxID=2975664 RepID=UPI002253B3A3|nr:hypothetical protein [Streptomyces sp. NBC_00140]MCX5328073.1 hypothetical protein [Streptomyces sp. NBC_00140]
MSDASDVEELTALLDATGLGALMALATLRLAFASATMERRESAPGAVVADGTLTSRRNTVGH